ncbi:MAG: hypothetical protein LUG49_04705 [Oscillospiraceae bacterium]|nr:hypothetical protein [Oscillospiraceae bacterium]
MEGFVLTNLTRDRYIYFDNDRRMAVTSSVNQAEVFLDPAKAYRVLDNQMPKKKRDSWYVVSVEPQSEPEPNGKFKADLGLADDEEVFDWDTIVDNIAGSYREILDYRDFLLKEQSKVELALCDIEHAIEFYSYNACDGYKMYKLFHDCRVRRREIKNDLRRINSILGMSYEQIASGGIDKAFDEVDTQTYHPRIMPELFEKKKNSLK